MASAEYQRQWRAKQGVTPRRGAPIRYEGCGSVAAYHRHIKHGEPTDADCRKAWREYQRDRRASQAAG